MEEAMIWMLFVLIACGGKQEPEPEPAPVEPVATQAPAPATDVAKCIDECQKSRMAEAVDWSVIEQQCQMSCSGDGTKLSGDGL